MSGEAVGSVVPPESTQPAAPVVTPPESPESDAPVSVLDHARQFGKADPEPDEKPAHHSQVQKRDKSTQQFREGRQRARSQQAGPEDVATINALTARIKAAEETEGADIARGEHESERVYQLRRRAEVLERRREAAKPSTPAPGAPAAIPRPEPTPPVVASTTSPPAAGKAEPKPDAGNAEKYPDGRYDPQFVEDLAAWRAREEWRTIQVEQQTAAERTASEKRWHDGVAEARAQFADFDAVALGPGNRIPLGSIPDKWILQHKHGATVLYHLQSHPQELDALLQADPFDAIQELTLLTQRLKPSSPAQAGTTGAAAGAAPRMILPKPPTPVRTEAQRATDEAPPVDGSLSVMKHARAFKRS